MHTADRNAMQIVTPASCDRLTHTVHVFGAECVKQVQRP